MFFLYRFFAALIVGIIGMLIAICMAFLFGTIWGLSIVLLGYNNVDALLETDQNPLLSLYNFAFYNNVRYGSK